MNVLVVGAYLDDGVALRRALVANKVPLAANIGIAAGTHSVTIVAVDMNDSRLANTTTKVNVA